MQWGREPRWARRSVAGFSLGARAAYICMRITFNTRSQSKSGLRSPALAKSITRQLLLFRELVHRSQNLFAVIQAIASRTLVDGQTVSEAKELFANRLQALARTYSTLAKNEFLGAPLKEILTQELTSFSSQATVTACDIAVNTRAAKNFALIIHELVTNAVKYGALSTRQGRVDIQCSIEGMDGKGQLRFEWKESGGPSVSQPTRKGFGSTILLEVAKQFGHDVQAKYAPEGLRYQLRLLLSGIEAPRIEVAPLAAQHIEPL